jgi:threonine/homoserine/homoserine lactone efflux protein
MEPEALAIFAAALLINSGTPGPSIAALVARVVSRGASDVLPFLAAMWIGEGLWLAAAVFGLAVIAESFHAAFIIVKYCGVVYLVYLAWRMWTSAQARVANEHPPKAEPWHMFLGGLSITLGNPKIMMFYLALLPSIIDVERIQGHGFAALVITMLIILMCVDLSWVSLAAGARRLMKSRRAVKIANRCGAAAMAGAAAAIAARTNG